jgi:hypothetical protein
MKNTSSLLTLIVLTMTSFSTSRRPAADSAEGIAHQVVAAFRQSSAESFVALLPSLSEFHELMQENASIYGNYLAEAKSEFTGQYTGNITRSAKASFERVLREGRTKGINWNEIRYAGLAVNATPEAPLTNSSFTVFFSAQGKEYRLHIDRALVIHSKWRVSPFIRLG